MTGRVVMAGPVPALHVFRRHCDKMWMPRSRPGMTAEGLDERTASGDAPAPSPLFDGLELCDSPLPARRKR